MGGVNTAILARFGQPFDPYPYIFLNLILSMVAAMQAPIILMSQNRQAVRGRLAANVNLKAELEIMSLHEKMDCVRIDHLEKLSATQLELLQRLAELIEPQQNQPRGETSEPNTATSIRTESSVLTEPVSSAPLWPRLVRLSRPSPPLIGSDF